MQELGICVAVLSSTFAMGIVYLIEKELFKRKVMKTIEDHFQRGQEKIEEAINDRILEYARLEGYKLKENITIKRHKRKPMPEEIKEKLRVRMIEMNKKRSKRKAEKEANPSPPVD